MKRALISIAIAALAGTMTAQVPTTPPPPPAQATPAPQASPAIPAAPATPAPPRSRVRVYRAAPAVAPSSGSYLGVDIRDVTSNRARELKLKNDQGVEITMVDQDSPAGKSGLKENDVIVTFNGQAIQSEEQFRRLIRETKPGQSVALGIMRDGQPSNTNVTLGDKAKMFGSSAKVWRMETPQVMVHVPDIEIPSFVVSQSSRRNGVTVENLTTQLGDYFGTKNGEGVLVRSVEKGSKAEAAGLKAGDVIIRVDNDRVSGTRDWSRLLRSRNAGTIKIGILRDRREQTLSMVVPENKDDESNSWYFGPDAEQIRMQFDSMGPQFAREQAEVQRRIAREWASHQKEMQQAMRDAQREMDRAMRESQTERERTLRDAQRERERALRDAQREKERLQKEKEKEKDNEE